MKSIEAPVSIINSPITVTVRELMQKSQKTREVLAEEIYNPEPTILRNKSLLENLGKIPFKKICQKIIKGEPLTFEESFCGMALAVASTNRAIFGYLKETLMRGNELADLTPEDLHEPAFNYVTLMAQKTSTESLSPQELAGVVAAITMDYIRLGVSPHVLVPAGVGADKGFVINGERYKVINSSTLSSILLSSLGVPILKHGGRATSSTVGSADAAEALGINIYPQSLREIVNLFDQTSFCFLDAWSIKTIHDISRGPLGGYETINHVATSLYPPVDHKTRLYGMLGVNERTHPELIAKTYELLHKLGYLNIQNAMIICGLSQDCPDDLDFNNPKATKPFVVLDELSPYKTLAAVIENGRYKGCVIISPADFDIDLPIEKVVVPEEKQRIIAADVAAIQGTDSAKSDYLAANAALGLFTVEYLGKGDAIVNGRLNKTILKECFRKCREAITSGKASENLRRIIRISNSH